MTSSIISNLFIKVDDQTKSCKNLTKVTNHTVVVKLWQRYPSLPLISSNEYKLILVREHSLLTLKSKIGLKCATMFPLIMHKSSVKSIFFGWYVFKE